MGTTIGVVMPGDTRPSDMTAYAQRAERLGFDTLWVVEDCFLGGGIAQTVAALAATSRITVGIGILPAAARNPAFAAMELATVAGLYPGRVIVGIGHGMRGWMRQAGCCAGQSVDIAAGDAAGGRRAAARRIGHR